MPNIPFLSRLVLIGVVLFCAVFYGNRLLPSAQPWQIETDLRSLAPGNQRLQQLAEPVDRLAASVQQQLLFLITLPEGQDASVAGEALAQALAEIANVALVDEAKVQRQLTDFISAYRQHLLTPEQQALLQSQASNQTIAQNALQQKYSLTATPQIIPFELDPLAWHSQFGFDLLSALDQGAPLPEHQYLLSARLDTEAFGMSGQAQLLQQIQQAEQGVLSAYPNSRIEHSGVFFYAAAAAADSRSDITRITTISGLAVVLLLLWVFRALAPVIFPVLTIALGVAFAFAVVHAWFGNVHVLTIVFGASLIGIVVDYSIHSFFHHPSGGDQRGLHKALLLSLVTSLVGYSALGFSHLPALSQVAVFSCAGMAAAWLAVVVLAPLMTSHLRPSPGALAGMQGAVHRHASRINGRLLSVLALLVVIAGGVCLWLKPGSDNPALFFNPNAQVLAMDRSISQQVGGYEPGTFVIFSADDEQTVADSTAQFFQAVAQDPHLQASQFVSVTQLLPQARQQQTNYLSQQRLYQDGGVLEHFYALLGLDPSALNDQKQAYYSAQNNTASSADLIEALSDVLPPLWQINPFGVVNIVLVEQGTNLQAVERLLAGNGNGVLYRTLAQAEQALSQQKTSAIALLLLAYGLVAGFLLWFYRATSALVILLIPMCGTALLLCCFALWGVELNLFHVCAAFLILGLGLDYGIFVYQMRADYRLTEQAVIISACTSLLSFGLLAFSKVPVVNSFGWALLIANSVNFMGALVFSAQLRRATNE